MNKFVSLAAPMAALTLLTLSPSGRTAVPGAAFDETCPGCVGSSEVDSDTCPGGGGVGISVIVITGLCTLQSDVGGPTQCREKNKCSVTITRTWNGVNPDTAMKFCWEITPGGRKGCFDPPPSSGPTGSGSDSNGPYEFKCGQVAITYSIVAECLDTTSVSADADGACGNCDS